jgi:hypothetical protein
VTARVVVSCDGTLPSGMSCRGALPTHVVCPLGLPLHEAEPFDDAYDEALAAGWVVEPRGDLCPACARRGAS